jgi:hypothetical protein
VEAASRGARPGWLGPTRPARAGREVEERDDM